jgi:hypothetical protein
VEDLYQDRFVVFVRDAAPAGRPEDLELAVVSCATYADAIRVRQRLRGVGLSCVIRSVGAAGGSD